MPIHMRLRKLRGPHMKKSMPFEQFGRTQTQPVNLKDLEARFDDGAEVTPESLTREGPRHPQGRAGEDPRPGRAHEEARPSRVHGVSASAREKIEAAGGSVELLVEPKKEKPRRAEPKAEAAPEPKEAAAGPDARGRPLARRPRISLTRKRSTRRSPRTPRSSPPRRSSGARDSRELLPRSRDPQEAGLHGGDAAALPDRRLHPGAGHQHRRRRGDLGELQRLERARLPEPLLGRIAAALRDLRARDHALHHGLDHPAAADGRGAVAREAPQGGRGRAAEDHAVHALPHRRARLRPVDRLRLPLPLLQHRHRRTSSRASPSAASS